MPQITLGEPVLVHQAPVEVKEWGPWQFPHLERLADGRIHLEFHVEADSVTAYGLPSRHALSADEGKSWEAVEGRDARGGQLLPNGDRLLPIQLQSRNRDKVTLPEPVLVQEDAPNRITHIYRGADFSAELSGWRFLRLRSGESTWIEETASVNMPGEIRIVREGMYAFWPSFHHGRLQLAPDGSLCSALHTKRIVGGRVQTANGIVFLRSEDHGYRWDLLGEIPYRPDTTADPQADRRDGFTEPEFNVMPDGTVLCLLRTHDLLGVGPLYWCRSLDSGQTWSHPRVFDDCGVWPRMLTLGNGITLASYGRPGLYVRATADPAGLEWEQRVVAVEPAEGRRDTCSYSALLALDDRTALLAYSDFNYPDKQGRKCKTILVRTVTVA